MKLAPKAVVGRVSLYLRQLEAYQRQGWTTVSSSQLGGPLSIKNAQVRKDLAFFGQFGHAGIGYRIDELIEALRHILGIDHDWPLALVGMGNLGRAVALSRLPIAWLPHRGAVRQRPVQDRDELRRYGRRADRIVAQVVAMRKIRLAILAVPADSAQRVTDLLVAAGIRGILNFAPVPLTLPPHVNLVGVDLGTQLENLAYKVQRTDDEVSCTG